jgi:hypothetical protein
MTAEGELEGAEVSDGAGEVDALEQPTRRTVHSSADLRSLDMRDLDDNGATNGVTPLGVDCYRAGDDRCRERTVLPAFTGSLSAWGILVVRCRRRPPVRARYQATGSVDLLRQPPSGVAP